MSRVVVVVAAVVVVAVKRSLSVYSSIAGHKEACCGGAERECGIVARLPGISSSDGVGRWELNWKQLRESVVVAIGSNGGGDDWY